MEQLKPFYRSDIDGLRAIAVSSVLVFHYWGQHLPGGFIGVDIFFVISGYLLSAIILSDVQNGRFTFSGFYERRIRRIFPALFLVLAVALVAGFFILLPFDLLRLFRSSLAASLSASNIYFGLTSNYFNGASGRNPLLHTWSLAVEEQFYIVFPIFIVVVHRYMARYLRVVLVLVALASLAWSIVDVRIDQTAAFYFPFSRAWELLLGAILTLRVIPPPRTRFLCECLAAAGLVGIIASVCLLSGDLPFPGEYAIVPCVSAAAIILAGETRSTMVGRLLSLKPVVAIGLISYSLYLWHWPILVFSTQFILYRPRGYHTILAIISVVVATISWRFVESPFRTGKHRPSKRMVLAFGAGCIAVFVPLTAAFCFTGGLPGRFPHQAELLASYEDYQRNFPAEFKKLFENGCFLELGVDVRNFNDNLCLAADADKPRVLVFGDSLAADLKYGLAQSMRNVHFLQATVARCHPVLGVPLFPGCKGFVDKVVGEYIPKWHIKEVILVADWGPSDVNGLTNIIQHFREEGVSVVVIGPRPEYGGGGVGLSYLLAKSLMEGDPGLVRRNRGPIQFALDPIMNKAARDTWHVQYVSLIQLVCREGNCLEYAAPGIPLQSDYAHLTLEGSEYIGRAIDGKYATLFDPE